MMGYALILFIFKNFQNINLNVSLDDDRTITNLMASPKLPSAAYGIVRKLKKT
jgi:hypothetical protein